MNDKVEYGNCVPSKGPKHPFDSAISVPQTPAWEDIRNTLDTATKNMLTGKMGARQALDQAAEEAQQLLDQYRT